MRFMSNGVFRRCGIASLRDLHSDLCRSIFEKLEVIQSDFSASSEKFLSAEYLWPRDPLRCWSRCWEYPYVFYHVCNFVNSIHRNSMPSVVDFGSGVTFFSYSIARLGCSVVCVDIYPICVRDGVSATKHVTGAPGIVEYRLIDEESGRTSLEDNSADCVYCVSVIEHVNNVNAVLNEISRILRPGGLFIVTFDLDIRGDAEIGVDAYVRLKESLFSGFDLAFPEASIHPVDMLTSTGGPYGLRRLVGVGYMQFVLRKLKRWVLGQPPIYAIPYHLAVEGMVLQKKAMR